MPDRNAASPSPTPTDQTPDVAALCDLLHSVWLYVPWQEMTRHLSTEQRELWLAVIEQDRRRYAVEDGEEYEPLCADWRWWADA